MKALVFGATGQVGRELAQRLPPGAEIAPLGRDRADLTDPAACRTAIADSDADVVINAAAYTAVDRAERQEALAMRINGEAPGVMARAAAAKRVPFLHISTDYVFDGTGTAPWAASDPTAPLGVYGRSKLAGERAVRAAGGRHVVLRTSWVFAAHGTNFVRTMLRLGATRDRIGVVRDQVGGPTPAADIADALWTMAAALHRGAAASGIYHFSGTPDISRAGFARAILAMAGLAAEIADTPGAEYPTPARRPENSRLDCRETEAVFDIGRPDWRHGLARVLAQLGKQTS